ncbi:MAG: hypothetical protein CM15mP49_17010 [Actinomycetota bacterium]|nr:MAG: hypothetical protein CM15mP49_17010 [Actinomycetota bacterium]
MLIYLNTCKDLIGKHFPQAAHSIGQGYGSSESCGVITSIGGQDFKDNPDSAGSPCLGYEVEIRDSDDNPLGEGKRAKYTFDLRIQCCVTGETILQLLKR